MSCVFRIAGNHLDVDALASSSPLTHYRLDRLGERRTPRCRANMAGYQDSCAHYSVSQQDFASLQLQVAGAIQFLLVHGEALRAMLRIPGIQGSSLDFGIERRNVFVQADLLPAALLSPVGALGIDIELSHYPAGGEDQ